MLVIGLRHLIGRILISIPLLLGITFSTFVLLFAIGDPATAIAGDTASAEEIEEIRVSRGFDRPVVVQYIEWLGHVLRGDLGESIQNRGDVSDLIVAHLQPTLELSVLALGIATAMALLTGLAVGLRPGGLLDRVTRGVSLLGLAIPNFLLGLGLILAFAIWLPLFPPGGYRSPSEVGILGTIEYLMLPALALALSLMCIQTRTFRASLLAEYDSDYVRTARMKGVPPRRLFFGHVARNASAPLVTVIGLEVGVLITGALLVEFVFAVPGVGTLTIAAVRGQDFLVVQALVAIFGTVVLVANLLADLVALWLNPVAREAS